MAGLFRHRQTKGAETDKLNLMSYAPVLYSTALLIQDVDELLAGRVAEASGDPEKPMEKPDFHGRP